MGKRFSYVRYDEQSQALQQTFRDQFESLEATVDSTLPPGRAKELLLNALEEGYMWVGKAIRDVQIARTGKVDEQPERNDE